MYSEMIFEQGFVHCDPHPGNILVNPNGDLILLDHGLYSRLSTKFREQYARLWLAIIDGDVKGIESVAIEMKVPANLTKIFTSIVAGRRWKAVAQGTLSQSGNASELREIKEFASRHIDLINAVLRAVPREMLLLFKTNDLLRGIEASLGTRHAAKSFVTMAQCCVRGVYARKLHEPKLLAANRLMLHVQEWFYLIRISVYQWLRWFMFTLADSFQFSK